MLLVRGVFISLMVYKWILLSLVQVKHKGEISQVFIIKNRNFRRGNKDKEFQQTNMQNIPKILLTSKRIPRSTKSLQQPLRQITSIDWPLYQNTGPSLWTINNSIPIPVNQTKILP